MTLLFTVYLFFLPPVIAAIAVARGVLAAELPARSHRFWRGMAFRYVGPATLVAVAALVLPALLEGELARRGWRVEAPIEHLAETLGVRGASLLTLAVAGAAAFLITAQLYRFIRGYFTLIAERCIDVGFPKQLALVGLIPFAPLVIGFFPSKPRVRFARHPITGELRGPWNAYRANPMRDPHARPERGWFPAFARDGGAPAWSGLPLRPPRPRNAVPQA